MKAVLIFGARPNVMKIAPLYRALVRHGYEPLLINTGQHYDKVLSNDLVEALQLPAPDFDLAIGAGTQAQQVARVLTGLEALLGELHPDVTIVVGDVSSTLAGALTSATLGIPIAHVEAGLRSGDWSMPEERNRVLTDRLSQFLFTTTLDAEENLMAEGIERSRIHYVGNVMIDTLDWVLPRLHRASIRNKYGVERRQFGIVTLHRPSNVDSPDALRAVMRGIERAADRIPLLFPVHPRTRNRLAEFGIDFSSDRIRPLPPLGYPEFISLASEAALIVTDSGGIQEETMVLGVPCLTLRENTERPITIALGMNELVKSEELAIASAVERVLSQGAVPGCRPPLWDGHSADRIAEILLRHFAEAPREGLEELERHPEVEITIGELGGAWRHGRRTEVARNATSLLNGTEAPRPTHFTSSRLG